MQQKRWIRFATLVMAVIAAYALAVSLLVPRLVERELKAMLEAEAGLSLTMGSVSVNPFTLSLSVTDFSLFGGENTPEVSIERLVAGIHVLSAFERTWILREVELIRPRLVLRYSGGEAAGFSRLSAALSRLRDRKPSLANASIAVFTVHSGELQAPGRPAPAGQAATVSNFDDIEFAAKKLSATAVMHSPWTLSATINGAGHLAASGEWARAPGGTTLRFSVILDDASILESRISAGPGLTWSGARLQSDGSFVWAADHARIDADVQLQKLEIAQINNGRPVFSVAAAEGVGIVFDTSTRPPVSVASVRLEHPRLHVERQRTGEADLPPWLRSLLFDTIRAPAWIKKVNVSAGRLVYSDRSIVPIRELASDDIVGTITQLRPGGEPRVAVSMTGRIAAAGSVELAADWLSSQPQDSTHVALKVQGIPLSAVSPFIAKALGRRFDGGDLAMNVRWSIEDDQLALENSLAIRNLQLGEVIANAPRANLELPLAAALLEDSCGVITLYMPLGWRPATPGVVPTTVIGDAIAHYVSELTSRPFETLAVLAGSPDVDLGRLTFPAGSATINDATAARLEALKLALSERPRLGLTIYPGFDPAADRKALARQQIRLHVMLATSSSPPAMAGEGAIDFNDSKVWTVLDEFSQQRLSDAQRAVIDGRPNKDATHYRAVFDALVANEVVAATALNRLARYRAQTIVNEFATSGYGNERIREADDIEATASGVATGVVRLDVWPLDDSESATEHGSPGSLTFAPRLTTLQ